MKKEELIAITSVACLLALVQLLAILVTPTFKEAKMQLFTEPEKISNVFIYLALILMVTLAVLVIVRYGLKKLVRAVILLSIFITIFYVMYPLLWKFMPGIAIDNYVILDIPMILALAWALTLTFYLYKYPEWYVVDATGIFVASGIASIFGLSFHILPAIILLLALAIYDVIAVYKTKHMIDLADSVIELRLPVLLVIPKKSGYSLLKQKPLKEHIDKGGEREAFFMGLGDFVIPSILTVSAFRFLNSITVAYFTMFGALIGFLVLVKFVSKGKPQAGLPLLNGGALIGYLLSYYLVFRNLTFGIV